MRLNRLRTPLPALLGLWLLPPLLGAAEAASPPPEAAAESLTATVRAVDGRARRIVVITGVGHALWLVRLEVARDCRIQISGQSAQLRDVKPGRIVRIQYQTVGEEKRALSIETVAVEGSGGGQ